MKTTLDLPDDLLIEAKATAARRRTTLKAIVEHALKREIHMKGPASDSDANDAFEISEYGLPVLKRSSGTAITSDMIYDMMEEEGI